MTQVPEIPDVPGGGTRQQRAAQLKAEMDAAQEQASAQLSSEGDQDRAGQGQTAEQAEQQGTGPVGQGDYVVKEGDCVSSIAKNSGHFWETIWNEPTNTELRQLRKDPNVLLPDDRVTVPAIRKKQEPGETEMRHRFIRRGEPAWLDVRVLQDTDEPRANEPYRLEIDGSTYEGVTDANGQIRVPMPGNAREATLSFSADGETYELPLGALDPLTEVGGIQGRLNNLGHDCGKIDGALGETTREGLRSFQAEQSLPVTGDADEQTRARLREVHGS